MYHSDFEVPGMVGTISCREDGLKPGRQEDANLGLGVGHEIKQDSPLYIQILLRDILKRLDWGGRSPREDIG